MESCFELCDDVGVFEDEQFLLAQLDLAASVFGQQNRVAHLHVHGDQLPVVIVGSGAGFQHDSVGEAVGLLQDDAGGGLGFGLDLAHHNPVEQGQQLLEVG